jgi:hypothetical protein
VGREIEELKVFRYLMLNNDVPLTAYR